MNDNGIWLVGGLEHLDYFPINIGFIIIPNDFHIFQRGGPTTNQTSIVEIAWILLTQILPWDYDHLWKILSISTENSKSLANLPVFVDHKISSKITQYSLKELQLAHQNWNHHYWFSILWTLNTTYHDQFSPVFLDSRYIIIKNHSRFTQFYLSLPVLSIFFTFSFGTAQNKPREAPFRTRSRSAKLQAPRPDAKHAKHAKHAKPRPGRFSQRDRPHGGVPLIGKFTLMG